MIGVSRPGTAQVPGRIVSSLFRGGHSHDKIRVTPRAMYKVAPRDLPKC